MLFIVIIFALMLGISALGIYLYEKSNMWGDEALYISLTVSSILFVVLIISGIIAIANNSGANGELAKKQNKYEILTYQFENNVYENDNDLGKKELFNDIIEYNADVAIGRAMQHDLWFGVFYPDIYYDLEFIEVGGE